MMQNNRQKSFSFMWIKLGVVFLLIVMIVMITYFIVTYNGLQKSLNKGFTETTDVVLAETDIVEIEQIERFQELAEYHIVFGKTADGIDQIVFVLKDNQTENITIVNRADIMDKDIIEERWRSNCQQCNLISVKPAFLSRTPLWELTYYDESNRYVFDYVSMADGSLFETVRLKRKFK